MYKCQKYYTPTVMVPCINDSVCMENTCLDDAVMVKCSCLNDTTQTVLFIHIYTSASIIKFSNSITKRW